MDSLRSDATTDGKSYVEEGLNAFQLDTVTNDLNTSNRYEEGPKNRFWTRNMQLQSTDVLSMDSLPSVLRSLLELHGIDIAKLDLGLILIERMGLAVPIHDGKLQTQHITPYTTPKPEDNAVQLFGFSPRARHVTVAPSEEERPTDPERLEALLVALKQYKESDITIEELMSEQLAGTPPARIFRSFVAPRNKSLLLEPLGRAANRTAAQIDMTLRQVRADNAAYLRNNDKSIFAANEKRRDLNPVVLVLDNVRSAFNVGSMFRTAETAGVAELITVGITAHPPHPKLRKTAFSSIDVVPHRHFDDIMICMETLKKEGYSIIAMETTSKSQIYTDVVYSQNVALVLGNEVTGVDTRVMEIADMIVEIPTYGVKNSLNVASAAPVVLFELLRQWKR